MVYRVADLVELGLAQRRQPHQEVDGLGLILGQHQLALQVLTEVGPQVLLQVQTVERAQGGEVAVVLAEDLFVGRDRLLEVTEHFLPELGHLEEHPLADLGLTGELDLLAVDLEQLVPLLVADVQLLQRLERRDVFGVERLRPAVELHRLVALAELLVVRRRHPHQKLAGQQRVRAPPFSIASSYRATRWLQAPSAAVIRSSSARHCSLDGSTRKQRL